MEYTLEIYKMQNGRSPYLEWLETVKDMKTKTAIVSRIGRLAMGNPGDFKNLDDGLCEMRIDHGQGIRIYYSQVGKKIILIVAGGLKRTQDKDVKRAKEFLKDFKKRKTQ